MAGASPYGGAPAMDASTGGGASIVDAFIFLNFFFTKRREATMVGTSICGGDPIDGGGGHGRRFTLWWSACHGRLHQWCVGRPWWTPPFFLKKKITVN